MPPKDSFYVTLDDREVASCKRKYFACDSKKKKKKTRACSMVLGPRLNCCAAGKKRENAIFSTRKLNFSQYFMCFSIVDAIKL